MFRSLKARKKLFALSSIFAIFCNLLQPLALSLVLATPVHAASTPQSDNFTYAGDLHRFDLTLAHVTGHVAYSLYYQTATQTEAVTGGGDSQNGSYQTGIYAGTQSGSSQVGEDVVRGILKTNSSGAQYFVIDGNTITVLAEVPSNSLELSSADSTWLADPSVFGDLQTGVTYHAPFDSRVSVHFTTLPDHPGNLSFHQLTLSSTQVAETGALTNQGYEITSDMPDGTFIYSLTLPNPAPSTPVSVQYSEDGTSFAQADQVSADSSIVTLPSLTHFTIFVVTGIENNSKVRINEFLYHPAPGDSQWIELYNGESSDVSLAGWKLQDADGHELALTGSLSAHTFAKFNVTWLDNTNNLLDGDTITLKKPWILGLYTIIDEVHYYRSPLSLFIGSQAVDNSNLSVGESIGRAQDGGSTWTTFIPPTPGYSNLGDHTAPVVTHHITPAPNGQGWNNSDPTITWTVSDPDSPITSLSCDPITITTESDQTVVSCIATSGGGTTTDSLTIKLDKTIPSTPNLLSPVDGVYRHTSDSNYSEWSTVTDLSGVGYRYQSASDPGFTHLYYDSNDYGPLLTATKIMNPNEPEVSYYWRVQACNGAGLCSAWSSPWQIHIDNTTPSVPLLTWPINGIFTSDNTPLMQWDDSTDNLGVAGYLYRVYYHCANPSDFNTCSQIYPDSLGLWLTASEYQAGATADGIYYWQVRSQDFAGNQSDWSESEQVTLDTVSPATPVGIYYRNTDRNLAVSCGQSTNAKHLDVYWTATSEPDFDHYEYISYNADGSTGPLRTFTTNYFNASWWTIPAEGTYGVQIRAVDKAGNKSPWSGGTQGVAYSCKYITDWTAPILTTQTTFGSTWYSTPKTSDFTYTDGASGIVSGTPVTCDISSEGMGQTCVVTPHVCDAAGNCNNNEVTSSAANLDFTAPESVITAPANPGSGSTIYTNAWTGEIQGTATDTLSGISRVQVSIHNSAGLYFNGTSFVSSAAEILLDATYSEGIWHYTGLTAPLEDSYAIRSHATDLALNVENTYQLTVVYDHTIPEVALAIDPSIPDAQNGWYRTRPTLTLTGHDSHLDLVEYQWDSQLGTWSPYTTPLVQSSEGVHVLYYRAHDLSGNYSDIGIKNLQWDQTALSDGPLNLRVSQNPTSHDQVTLTWDSASDNTGIDHYEVQWKLGSVVHTDEVANNLRTHDLTDLTEGDWTVIVRAFDGSGQSKEASLTLTVDRTAPSAPRLTLTGTTAGSASLSWNSVEGASSYLIWYGTQPGTYLYGANVGNTTNYTVQGLGAGSYYFIVSAHDAAGNGSVNSNEVATGALIGAAGIAPGTPATGFTTTPAVLGAHTDNQDTSAPSTTTATGVVLGTNITSWLTLIMHFAWIWLPLLLLLIFIFFKSHQKRH